MNPPTTRRIKFITFTNDKYLYPNKHGHVAEDGVG